MVMQFHDISYFRANGKGRFRAARVARSPATFFVFGQTEPSEIRARDPKRRKTHRSSI